VTTLIGLRVQLDRPIDRAKPCCRNLCTLAPGKGPHAYQLVCEDCGAFRGWMSRSTANWITHVVERCGKPPTPIVVRKSTHPHDELSVPTARGTGLDDSAPTQGKMEFGKWQ
jgi:hypothetical protein